MPRLNNDRYLSRYHWLRQVWLNRPDAFSWLRPNQQWDIHDYYRPSEDLTREQLLKHRKEITKERPGLAQTASKALMILTGQAPAPTPYVGGFGKRQIMVRPLVRPQIDIEKLCQALIKLAESKGKQKQSL